jgi:hypothetical protein
MFTIPAVKPTGVLINIPHTIIRQEMNSYTTGILSIDDIPSGFEAGINILLPAPAIPHSSPCTGKRSC